MIQTLTSVNTVLTMLLVLNLLLTLRRPHSRTVNGERLALAAALLVFAGSLLLSAHLQALGRADLVPWILAAPWLMAALIAAKAAARARWN